MKRRFKNLRNYNLVTFLFIFICNLLKFVFAQNLHPLNTSEDVKRIFQPGEISKHSEILKLNDISKTQNFAEGGIVKESSLGPQLILNSERASDKNQDKSGLDTHHEWFTTKKNVTSKLFNNFGTQREKDNVLFSDPLVKQPFITKLNETGTNLFLGVPEVVHINGTSSIKPRKGVYFNKIVPRKGVDSVLLNNSCFSFKTNICYSSSYFPDTNCNCCLKGNALAKTIKEQPLVNCNNCKLVKTVPQQKNLTCQNICCSNNLNSMHSTTVTHIKNINGENSPNKSSSIFEKKISQMYQVKGESISINKVHVEKNKEFGNFIQKLKPKPSITKVPYDVEIVTELSSKFTTKIFTPIIVCIFALPLIGIPLFFLYRRTKEYWDKRYYKRMDFLIDGMYND